MSTTLENELEQFLAKVTEARGGDISDSELATISAWFLTMSDGVNLLHMVMSGSAIMFWDDATNQPMATLTTKGADLTPTPTPAPEVPIQTFSTATVDKRYLN
ncbi:MAG: hypothetical protein L3J47_00165 [Sulfurovum sp.]|nr:hypothetical protein [Sulfurovum sp.]